MKIKYDARIFDQAKGDFWHWFWFNESLLPLGRYRIDLFRIEKGGEEKEVDWVFVSRKKNINKAIKKMVDKQRNKYRPGQIGNIKVELEI